MRTYRPRVVFGLTLLALGGAFAPWILAERPKTTSLRFEVTVRKGLLARPQDGRLLIVLGNGKQPEPRYSIFATGMDAPPLLGKDVTAFAPGVTAVVDEKAALFPIDHLAHLPPGTYVVQAVLDLNRDLKLHDAPGNLYSDPVSVTINPARGETVKLELTHPIGEDEPAESEHVKFVKVRSELLSRFHGRPMYLRAGVILPRDFERDKDKHYPLRVQIGGYGTRYTEVLEHMGTLSPFRQFWLADTTPRMILLLLDGAGPFGDPYQVNSANNGPYGDAVTQELIPYVERKYRGIGKPYARVLDGSSTGGWVSLALQVFYPDFFNGCWSSCPDPVDFRAYELIDIYRDENAYVNRHGFERPAMRDLGGDVLYTVRHEVQMEKVLGPGDRWELSGKDWCAWNATFGPRGADGLPKPLWDGKTGKIDRSVVEHWQKYDLRLVLEKNWKTLGPKLRGKIHIWVGEADDYFLNNAVHLLDQLLSRAKPAFEGRITFAPGQGHTRGWSEKQIMEEMAAAVAKGREKESPR
jgi:hypothetical protein